MKNGTFLQSITKEIIEFTFTLSDKENHSRDGLDSKVVCHILDVPYRIEDDFIVIEHPNATYKSEKFISFNGLLLSEIFKNLEEKGYADKEHILVYLYIDGIRHGTTFVDFKNREISVTLPYTDESLVRAHLSKLDE